MLRSLPLSVNVARSHTKKHVLLTNIEKGGGELAAPDGSHPPCYASVISEVTLKNTLTFFITSRNQAGLLLLLNWAIVYSLRCHCFLNGMPLIAVGKNSVTT